MSQLQQQAGELSIRTIKDDLLQFQKYCDTAINLCVCMGDTLTHLNSKTDVVDLFAKIYQSLALGGFFITTFRDLSFELKGLERFIPIRNDDNRIFTCFLEYEPERVKVHDLIYQKQDGTWELNKSCYYKCRLDLHWVKTQLINVGFEVQFSNINGGLVTILASK